MIHDSSWHAALRSVRFFLLLVLAVAGPLAADAPLLREPRWQAVDGVVDAPSLTARAAILVDVSSQTVLFAHNPDLVIPPASLTKLVAIDAALRAAAMGEVSLDETFTPPPASWAVNQPPGSSLMFLGPGQELTLRELLLGLSVSSGNDAAVALALLLDGSVPAFAMRMNAVARDLELVDLFFEEPSGLSPRNSVTARALARFVLAHLEAFPWALDELYSVERFTYPASGNRVGAEARGPITQWNRNVLIGEFEGADGLKTGFIDESGYHLAATAERDGRRLLAIVLGIDADSHAVGGAVRAAEATALLDYGFDAFELVRLGYPEPRPVRVYRGAQIEAVPEGPAELAVSVPRGARERITGTIDQIDEIIAPAPRANAGTVTIELDGVVLGSGTLVLPAQEEGGLGRRVTDGLRLFGRRVRGLFVDVEWPVSADGLVPATRSP